MNLSNIRQSVRRLPSKTLPRIVLAVLTTTPLMLMTLASNSCKQDKTETPSNETPSTTPRSNKTASTEAPTTSGPKSANVRTRPSTAPTVKKSAPLPHRDTPSHAVAKTHITCKATLKKLQPDYPWFENHGSSHSDGRAPLATFTVTQPKKYAGKTVSILFKYKKPPTSPPKKDVGKTFTFKIPQDFFTSKARILDNISVRDLKQVRR